LDLLCGGLNPVLNVLHNEPGTENGGRQSNGSRRTDSIPDIIKVYDRCFMTHAITRPTMESRPITMESAHEKNFRVLIKPRE
jgi:hypothetical protein